MKSIKVIKIGGNVVENQELLESFARDFAAIDGPKILVHGGGVMASAMQKQLGTQPVMVAGRRVTDSDTLKIVTMVYAGWCNKNITATLQKYGCNAIGLSGADGNAIKATKRPLTDMEVPGEGVRKVDFGYAGDIRSDAVNTGFILSLTESGLTPVFCAITHNGEGMLLNTNADTVASSIASALAGYCETELVYCFEKDGVLYDREDESSVIPEITPSYYRKLKEEGRIADGMIPKIDNSFKAIGLGVSKVTIKHARNLLNGKGTVLRQEQ